MTTLYLPKERQEWFRDRDGVWSTSKDNDEVKSYTVDFSYELGSGETLSTLTLTASGVTVDSSSITTGIDGANKAALMTISDTDGHVEVKVTTSSSRTLVRDVRFMGVPHPRPERDYR